MKKWSALFVFLFFCLGSLYAQLPSVNKAKAQKIKDKTLIVAFEEEDNVVIKKQELIGVDLKRYTDQIEGRNYALKNGFENFWKFNTSILYMPYSKALELSAKEKNKYIIVRFSSSVDPKFSIKKTKNGAQIGWLKDDSTFTYNSFTRQTHAVNKPLKLTFETPKEVAYMYLPNFYPAKSDVVYAVKTIQFIFNYMLESEKHNIGMLKNKKLDDKNAELKDMTLFVDKADCNPPMTEIQVQKLYPYNLKTVFFNNIEDAWNGNDAKVAILVPFMYEKGKDKEKQKIRANIIVNSATGKIYCIDCIKFKFGEFETPVEVREFNE